MEDLVRAFIAIEINDVVRQGLSAIQDKLRDTGAHVGWVKPENIHCTLVFLGDLFPQQVAAASEALVKVAAASKPFAIEIKGLGFFGSARSPRVILASIEGEVNLLIGLQAGLAAALSQAGLQFDSKPFKPHLTIGRVRSSRNAQALVDALGETVAFGKIAVERAVLMKSSLTSQGPVYSLLQAAPLGDGEG